MSINMDINRELAESKVVLLYIIDMFKMPVTNTFITRIVLENRFINYFFLQQYLSDLTDDHYLDRKTEDMRSLYSITPKGQEVVKMFIEMVPVGLKRRMETTIKEIRKNYRNQTHVTAEYFPESEHEFYVKCNISEDDFSLIDLNLTVGSKEEALKICNTWKRHADVIYPELLESLMKNREDREDTV